jgi:cholera toxin transcriptional activator
MPLRQAHPDARIARFGVFEVDVAAGSLRKKGSRLRLQEQPFQMLLALLDRPGDVVTREELRQKLWPADTFVDFDHSLNTAIKKIREALGDSASSPRFVETLARRGYRFLAPVEWVQPGFTTPANAGADENATAVHPELQVPVPRRSVTRVLFGLIQAMYLVFYGVALFRLQAIDQILQSFLPTGGAFAVLTIVLVTAGIGIPLRCYLLSAVVFDYRRLGEKFRQMFPWLLVSDELWAAAPLLLMQNIGFGAAFAATAALLYVPFSERTLIRLAY